LGLVVVAALAAQAMGDFMIKTAPGPNISVAIEVEILRIQSLNPDQVRALWRETFRKEIPKSLTRDLLVRTLCWHIQERVSGGHSAAILKLLAGYARSKPGDVDRLRRLKPGTELVREFQGERHTVVITAEGYRWREGDYPSLTAVARAITGGGWNGPRFFGLRESSEGRAGVAGKGAAGEPNAGGGRERRAGASQ
jgi:hypothetical protein